MVGGEDEIDLYALDSSPKKNKAFKDRKEKEKVETESKDRRPVSSKRPSKASPKKMLKEDFKSLEGEPEDMDEAMEGEEAGED